MKKIQEVVIYKYFTEQDIKDLTDLINFDYGFVKLSDGTFCTLMGENNRIQTIDLEILHEQYEQNKKTNEKITLDRIYKDNKKP